MAARRMPMTTRCALRLALLAACAACSDRSAPGADPMGSAALDDLEVELAPDAPLDQVLNQKAKKYAVGFVADAEPILGTLPEGQRADHLSVLRGGHCYRMLGVGAPEIEDLDLFLFDPNGVQVQQDAAQDRYPVVGMQADICPAYSGAFRLQVQARTGGGAYAVRVYRTP
jgi:hypothetical protein